MADFMLGDMRTFDQGTGEYKYNRNFYSSAFFQDDYKIHPRLSLNIGVRYEPTPPWHEVVGRIQIFDLDAYHAGRRTTLFDNAPPGVFFRGDPGVPEDGTLADYNNVSFRGGAAWDLTGDGKTSLRGGWGMFYDQHIIGRFNNGATNNPPWSIRMSVTEPVGPFSDPYLGRDDFDSISLEGGRQTGRPVPAAGEREQLRQAVQYAADLQLQPHAGAGSPAGMDGARRIRRIEDHWWPEQHQPEPGDLCAGRDDRHDRCASCPPTVRRHRHLRAGWMVEVQRDAADAQSAVLTRLYDQFQLHAGEHLSATSAAS